MCALAAEDFVNSSNSASHTEHVIADILGPEGLFRIQLLYSVSAIGSVAVMLTSLLITAFPWQNSHFANDLLAK